MTAASAAAAAGLYDAQVVARGFSKAVRAHHRVVTSPNQTEVWQPVLHQASLLESVAQEEEEEAKQKR